MTAPKWLRVLGRTLAVAAAVAIIYGIALLILFTSSNIHSGWAGLR